MKISELRIGNWVTDGFGNCVEVTGIISENNTSGYKTETLKPIPITEKLLIQCGFKDYHFSYSDNCILLQSGVISKEDNRYFVYSGLGGADSYGFEVKLEYLHQLQNLYHALTGEELPVNLQ